MYGESLHACARYMHVAELYNCNIHRISHILVVSTPTAVLCVHSQFVRQKNPHVLQEKLLCA